MSTQTPSMGLTVPATSIELGPAYANQINGDLSILDSHNHTAGLGVPIPSGGLNINSDLTFAGNNLTSARSIRFQAQGSPLALASDLGCVYESGVDLYYNDGNGNQVRITQSGGVAGSPGSITNLVSPASASYVAANQTYVWQSDTNTPANLDAGSVIFRNVTSGSNGITMSAPAGLATNYSLTLPALPVTKGFLTLTSAGVISAATNFTGGILGSNIANDTITTTNISSSAAIVGTQLSTLAAGLTPYQMGDLILDVLAPSATGVLSGTLATVGSLSLTLANNVHASTGFARPWFICFQGEISFSTVNVTQDFTILIRTTNGITARTIASFSVSGVTLAQSPVRMPIGGFNCIASTVTQEGFSNIVIQMGGSTADARITLVGASYTVVQV